MSSSGDSKVAALTRDPDAHFGAVEKRGAPRSLLPTVPDEKVFLEKSGVGFFFLSSSLLPPNSLSPSSLLHSASRLSDNSAYLLSLTPDIRGTQRQIRLTLKSEELNLLSLLFPSLPNRRHSQKKARDNMAEITEKEPTKLESGSLGGASSTEEGMRRRHEGPGEKNIFNYEGVDGHSNGQVKRTLKARHLQVSRKFQLW